MSKQPQNKCKQKGMYQDGGRNPHHRGGTKNSLLCVLFDEMGIILGV